MFRLLHLRFKAPSVGEENVKGSQGGVGGERRGTWLKSENLGLLVPVAGHHREEVGILCGIEGGIIGRIKGGGIIGRIRVEMFSRIKAGFLCGID